MATIEDKLIELSGWYEEYSELVDEFAEEIKECVAEPHSEEGQEVIHDGRSHVVEVWQDGEVTSTKAGDLYRKRLLHQKTPPFVDEENRLWGEEGNQARVVVNRDKVEELYDEYVGNTRGLPAWLLEGITKP